MVQCTLGKECITLDTSCARVMPTSPPLMRVSYPQRKTSSCSAWWLSAPPTCPLSFHIRQLCGSLQQTLHTTLCPTRSWHLLSAPPACPRRPKPPFVHSGVRRQPGVVEVQLRETGWASKWLIDWKKMCKAFFFWALTFSHSLSFSTPHWQHTRKAIWMIWFQGFKKIRSAILWKLMSQILYSKGFT